MQSFRCVPHFPTTHYHLDDKFFNWAITISIIAYTSAFTQNYNAILRPFDILDWLNHRMRMVLCTHMHSQSSPIRLNYAHRKQQCLRVADRREIDRMNAGAVAVNCVFIYLFRSGCALSLSLSLPALYSFIILLVSCIFLCHPKIWMPFIRFQCANGRSSATRSMCLPSAIQCFSEHPQTAHTECERYID